jgi:hypothetical protein
MMNKCIQIISINIHDIMELAVFSQEFADQNQNSFHAQTYSALNEAQGNNYKY